MSWRSRVVWSQGMFLQPHHFQQEARHVEHTIDTRVRALGPHGWGFSELVLDDNLLATGQLGIVRASGILPDGTPFSMPHNDRLPPPLMLPPDLSNETIYLVAPLSREGGNEVDFGDAPAHEQRRYRAFTEELRDHTNAGDEAEAVQTGLLNFAIVRERDAAQGVAALGIARAVERRNDGQVVLDRSYIAPQTRIDASAQLSGSAALLHGLVQQRSHLLASRMGQLGHGVSELADFLMLQSLNRVEPVLHQYAGAPHVHPQQFYMTCIELAGDLSTFVTEERHGADYPIYRHDDLRGSFTPVVDHLRHMLSSVLERNATQITMVERSHGVRTGVVPDLEMLRSADFVLAVNAQLPGEQVRQRFASQSKFGPVDRIRDLVNLQLPGIALRLLPVAPRQLPFHAGFHYFELDRGSELWRQLEKNPGFALHVAGDLPGLELELWAIRR
jgi:type VI secretion system protein ImpJ